MNACKSHTEEFTIRTCDCDLAGTLRPGALMECMQETAIAHCDRLALSRQRTDALGVAWVLSRLHMTLPGMPAMGARISVETWPMSPRHLFYPRMFTVRDAGGAVIGQASSLWVLMDLQARRITDRPEVRQAMPDNRDMPLPVPLPGALQPMPGDAKAGEIVPGYADFDLNGHVNNTRYMDWCCSALGLDTMARCRLAEFTVIYEGEIRSADPVKTRLQQSGAQFFFSGSAADRRAFAIGGTLIPRD